MWNVFGVCLLDLWIRSMFGSHLEIVGMIFVFYIERDVI